MISQAAEYALRSVVSLGLRPGRCLTAREIAEQNEISVSYLYKILQMLVRAGLVGSHRGLGGGFDLARPPARMTVLDVVNAVDPIRQKPRGPASHAARRSPPGEFHRRADAWITRLESVMARLTVADLMVDPGPGLPEREDHGGPH